MKKLPDTAFAEYVRLGSRRSYESVAARYGVTKRAVLKRARAERWSQRLAAIEREAQAEIDRGLVRALVDSGILIRSAARELAPRAEAALVLPLDLERERRDAAGIVLRVARLLGRSTR